MNLVVPLSAIGKQDLALAGGKGANLGELVRAGFPVPDGFVVTTDAYASVVQAADGLHGRIDELLSTGDDDGAALRADFAAVVIPPRLLDAISAAYAKLGGGPVAVRSSATAEDLPGAAFAGQQDTYLNIVGEDALVDAVRQCWGSLWTDRAIAYRRRRGIDSASVRIAVVVQEMVPAEAAGVMFTANPVTGERNQLVVDASSGLGEAVVSGLVTPDHYVLGPYGSVREWTLGRREVVITAVPGGGVRHEQGGAGAAERLPDAVLAELARLGTGVARHFGRPQDIEWACVRGRVRLLQARPMTALPPPPVRLNRLQRRTGAVLLDYLTDRPYPMDMSTWVPDGPVGMMAKITASFGVHTFENFLFEQDGVVDRFVPPSPRPTPKVLTAPFRVVALARRYDTRRWTEDPRFVDFLASVEKLAGEDLGGMPWTRLVRMPRRALALIEPMSELRRDYLPGVGVAMVRLWVALRWLGRGELMSGLLHGAHTRTQDANNALAALAERVRDNRRLAEVVDRLDVAGLAEFPEFQAEFAAFLAEYGHRETASPILVSPPTLGECPETVLGLVKVLAEGAEGATDSGDQAMAALLRHPRLREQRARARITNLVELVRAGVAFREDSHFYFTKPLPVLRRSLLEIGRRLSAVGVLGEPADVFHLRLEEIEGIAVADPARMAESTRERLRGTVLARAARRAELDGVRLIDPALIYPPRDSGDALVVGAPASSGRVTGPVRVVREPAEFGTLTSGDILVCPYTNPAWTPLFQRAAAVVVDSGGAASHAAIVAREYGIPAVMGTGSGTRVLTDGQLVTVDGNTGRVTAHTS